MIMESKHKESFRKGKAVAFLTLLLFFNLIGLNLIPLLSSRHESDGEIKGILCAGLTLIHLAATLLLSVSVSLGGLTEILFDL